LPIVGAELSRTTDPLLEFVADEEPDDLESGDEIS
jgi:hypothetical protein